MAEKDYEILVRYNSWNVETYDTMGNLLTELKCKSNHWLSNFHSGAVKIEGKYYSLLNNSKGIRFSIDSTNIAEIVITISKSFGRYATVQIGNQQFTLNRDNLKQQFIVTDKNNDVLFLIEGKSYKDKQKNLFGLIYLDDKLFHSIFLSKHNIDKTLLLILLTIFGYCIRVFLEIDTGDYPGEINLS